jgi:hypothetical protein
MPDAVRAELERAVIDGEQVVSEQIRRAWKDRPDSNSSKGKQTDGIGSNQEMDRRSRLRLHQA